MTINQKTINTLRVISAEMISQSGVGDTRSCFTAAPILFTFFKDYYNYFGGESNINRDRFILADQKVTPLYYALLHYFGLDVTIEDLQSYAKFGSRMPANPQFRVTDGVDITVENPGQAVSNAVGLAIAQASLSEKFNAQRFNIISNYTFVYASENDLKNGKALEAIALAGELKLKNLIIMCNQDKTQKSNENEKKKYNAMGWSVIHSPSGNSPFWLSFALTRAKMSVKPTIILFKTQACYETTDKISICNSVLKNYEVEKLKADLGLNGKYNVPNDVKQLCMHTSRRLKVEYSKWERKAVLYKNTHPQLSEELNGYFEKPKINFIKQSKNKIDLTTSLTQSNKNILSYINHLRPCLMGLANENYLYKQTQLPFTKPFSRYNYRGKNINLTHRKDIMCDVANGISLYYNAPTITASNLFNANNYVNSITLATKMGLSINYVFTNDSFFACRHNTIYQPLEQLQNLRNIKNNIVFRPANSLELLACYSLIYEMETTTCTVLASQEMPEIQTDYEGAQKGAYVLTQDENAQIIIFASGSEVTMALEAKKLLNKSQLKVCVVSVPCVEIFVKQTDKYKASVINNQIKKRIAIEASNDDVWTHFVGENGLLFNVKDYAPNGTSEEIADYLGFSMKELMKKIKNL